MSQTALLEQYALCVVSVQLSGGCYSRIDPFTRLVTSLKKHISWCVFKRAASEKKIKELLQSLCLLPISLAQSALELNII